MENDVRTAPSTYRVLIADDHPLARKAVLSMLQADSSFDVVGQALHGEEAVLLCGEVQPDLVLMDVHMAPMGGLEATRRIKHMYPHIRVVMLTVSDDVADLFTALQFGAQGYLLKNMDPDEWLAYLHALLDNNSEIARQMADRLFLRFRAPVGMTPGSDPNPSMLTSREQEITARVAIGENNRQIASKLIISENTVKNHMKNILEKLNLENRVQLTAYAIKYGLTRKE
jgi:two-component system nitrate/nitrite response regulator NarL